MVPEGTDSFAALLRRYRGAAGLTQEALAEQARISARAVSDLERGGERSPRLTTVALLAVALGLAPEQRAEFIAAAQRAGQRAENIPGRPQAPAVPTAASLPAPPAWLTSLVGREREEAAIATLLRGGARLVTLTGPGGVGKTRLAATVALTLAGAFPDGVAFVDLTALREPEQVLPTVAHALAVKEEAGRPLAQTLAGRLRGRALLLVLDNMEQVAGAGPALVALLGACPRLQALVTSRAALRVQGEQEHPVPPLALPAAGGGTLAAIADAPAVQLFVQRAQAARPDFALRAENAAAVAALCRRLDGLPLALELAAARIKLLPPATLLRRLERDVAVLGEGRVDRPARHRTLEATIAWSYTLLNAEERALFARLAVFAGGGTLEAVEAVCAGPGQGAGEVLRALEGLVDQSLVLVEGGDEPRARMLETIREYARGWLAASGEEEAVRDRHLARFLALAEAAAPHLTGPGQGTWLDRLEAEHDNLRAALRWAREQRAGAQGLRLAGALWRFWAMRGYLSEGRGWLERSLDIGTGVSAAPRAGALHGAGDLARHQGDYGEARALLEGSLTLRRELEDENGIAASLNSLGAVAYQQGDYGRALTLHEEALALWRTLGNQRGIAASLNSLGIVALDRGDYGAARARFEESLSLLRQLGDTWGMSNALNSLGLVADFQGEYGAALALHEEGLTLKYAVGDRWGIGNALNWLGLVARHQGDYEAARVRFEESLTLFQELADKQGVGIALGNIGNVALDRGDYDVARARFEQCLALFREMEDRRGTAESLEELARLAGVRDQAERAAVLFGAATALRASIGVSLTPNERARHEQARDAVRAALGEEAFAAAWAAGQALPLEEAIALALERSEAATLRSDAAGAM